MRHVAITVAWRMCCFYSTNDMIQEPLNQASRQALVELVACISTRHDSRSLAKRATDSLTLRIFSTSAIPLCLAATSVLMYDHVLASD
jgi:hypothetical protein